MACAGCSTGSKDGQPGGCQSKGNCGTGGCNRLNTYDWLSAMDIEDVDPFHVVEVSFKNGARKAFYYNQPYTRANTGDIVVVESQGGYDMGRISLSGELVRLQMRKKRVREEHYFPKIVRKANERDLEKHQECREAEQPAMVRARAIARTMNLNMKIGDVEMQADGRKATFFYTADGRIDFRELIRHFAKEFKVKIEMRQIGARQEAARVGGIGPCGRELCCSTWLTSYRTVSTAAARYQNLAINQAKLSGQCGRLKCCLNYELDTYMEALASFPEDAEKLRTKVGLAVLFKTDIFKGLMYYSYETGTEKGKVYTLSIEEAKRVRAMNSKGEFPQELVVIPAKVQDDDDDEPDFEDVTGAVELPPDERSKRKKKKKNKDDRMGGNPDSNRAGGQRDATSGRSPERSGGERPQRSKGGGERRDTPPRRDAPRQDASGQPKPPGEKRGGGGERRDHPPRRDASGQPRPPGERREDNRNRDRDRKDDTKE